MINMTWKEILKNDRGVGDTISRITGAVGIKPCSSCKERRNKLNKRFKYAK